MGLHVVLTAGNSARCRRWKALKAARRTRYIEDSAMAVRHSQAWGAAGWRIAA